MANALKKCCRCQNEYPATAEFFSRRRRDGVEGLTSQCKACRKAMWAAQYSANREYHIARATETSRVRRYKPEVREKERVASRLRKRLVLSDTTERQRHRERTREWFASNPDRVKQMPSRSLAALAHKTALRMARKKRATPQWADLRLIAAFYKEARVMTEKTGIPHEVDHEVPLNHPRVSGLHVPENLRVIRAEENRKKSNNFSI